MAWHKIEQRPTAPGTYVVRLFTGVICRAYWTGKVWGATHTAETRKNASRSLVKALREWSDNPAVDAPELTAELTAWAPSVAPVPQRVLPVMGGLRIADMVDAMAAERLNRGYCPRCEGVHKQEPVGQTGAQQANGCDVDFTTWRCTSCQAEWTGDLCADKPATSA